MNLQRDICPSILITLTLQSSDSGELAEEQNEERKIKQKSGKCLQQCGYQTTKV